MHVSTRVQVQRQTNGIQMQLRLTQKILGNIATCILKVYMQLKKSDQHAQDQHL